MLDPYAKQLIVPSRTPWSNEECARKNEELIRRAVDEYIVAAGVTLTVTDEGGTRTFREGDPLRKGIDIVSWQQLEKLLRDKDVLRLSKSRILINTNDPASRYIVNPQGKAISVATGIKDPGEVLSATDCHREPDPPVREKVKGGWIEIGERHPGIDGEELLQKLVARGDVIDRKLVDRVTTAAKKVLSKSPKTSKQAAE